jgi:hypothetical protein
MPYRQNFLDGLGEIVYVHLGSIHLAAAGGRAHAQRITYLIHFLYLMVYK